MKNVFWWSKYFLVKIFWCQNFKGSYFEGGPFLEGQNVLGDKSFWVNIFGGHNFGGVKMLGLQHFLGQKFGGSKLLGDPLLLATAQRYDVIPSTETSMLLPTLPDPLLLPTAQVGQISKLKRDPDQVAEA